MSNPINSSFDASFDPSTAEQAFLANQEFSEQEFDNADNSTKHTLDARRRLENKLEDLALERDIKEFNFDL